MYRNSSLNLVIKFYLAVVCSLHFAPCHIDKPLIQKLLHYSLKLARKLRDDAIPLR